MPTIAVIAAARPNFMKIAPLMRALDQQQIESTLIHTGQHYDQRMSGDFFQQLGIREPDVNLAVGSGSHVFQIAEVMRRLEETLQKSRPHAIVVVGDVNSTLAATLTAVKLDIPVAHVEAGLRSNDRSMPEEVNRLLVDAVSRWLFVSEPAGLDNLSREGISPEYLFHVGNIMIDTLLEHLPKARNLKTYERYDVKPNNYAILTLHRPSNVDDKLHLTSILRAVRTLSMRMPVLFPVHPRTVDRIREFDLMGDTLLGGYIQLEPLGYQENLCLMDSARVVLTDSGGVQEETTALRVPCLTLRDNTERPITITQGSNRLVGWRTDDIEHAIAETLAGPSRIGAIPELWDGRTALRIAEILRRDLPHS